MQNLASRKYEVATDIAVKEELTLARIGVVLNKDYVVGPEVITYISGQLGAFTFTRSWRYWVVSGRLPLNVAKEIYADPLGKADVRAAGHCGCVDPVQWCEAPESVELALMEKTGFSKVVPECGGDAFQNWIEAGNQFGVLYKKERQENLTNDWFVDLYHIDSLAGLRLFADTLRKYGLT